MHLTFDLKGLKPEEIAEKFAKEQLLDLENGLFLVHSAAVKFVSLNLAEHLQDVDTQVLVVASWLHNIGKVRGSAGHEIIGCGYTQALFKNMPSDFYYTISDCVLNHCCSKKPETIEGEILHDADKIAFLHPTYLDFVKAEFEREGKAAEFTKFVKEKIAFRDSVLFPKGLKLFDEYAESAMREID